MSIENLKKLIESEDIWFSIRTPSDLHSKILRGIELKNYQALKMLKIFKVATAVCFFLLIAVSSALVSYILLPSRIVYVYPHSGSEKSVHVIGKFNKKEEKIPLMLDEEKGIWKAIIRTHKIDVSDVEFVVEEYPEEDLDEVYENDPSMGQK